MSGRSLFTHAAKTDLKVAEAHTPSSAVALYEQDLGRGLGRTEFYINGNGEADYWPSLHAWPSDVAEKVLNAARRWLQGRPDRKLLATSAYVDAAQKPVVCVFVLHHTAAQAVTPSLPGEAQPSAAEGPGAVSPPGSAPPPERCSECGN